MASRSRRAWGLGFALVTAPAIGSPADEPPLAQAAPASEAPLLDGDVLGERTWEAASPLTEFWQTTPDEGKPASERTEVRILYTKEALYFGVVCFDREPERIVVNESRRDSPLDETDSFQIILDTYRDRQNGFVFGTNPAGLEYDGQVTKEGEGAGRFGSSLEGFNLNWDGSWRVRTRVGRFGWSAEFAIPFRTLRYGGGRSQSWGLNLQRNIRRRNETAFWAPIGRQFNLYRLSLAGTLAGLEAPPPRNLKLSPYARGDLSQDRAVSAATKADAEVGGDLKWSASASLALDLTFNTDFAQVEADEQQINLDRFNLFFKEKRPFFLENAGFFTVGTPEEAELFFSRRIGIGPEGELIPIWGGARLSGKAAGFNLGLLDMQTRAVDAVAPANNFAVARVSRDLPRRSGVGAIFVNRQSTGEDAPADDHNRTLGLDGRWGFGRYGQLSGWLARTFTPGRTGSALAWNASAAYTSPDWNLSARYTEVGLDFNPEVGFLRRRGYRKPEFLVLRARRMGGFLGLLEARPHVSYSGFWKPDGFQESGFVHLDNHLEWRSGWELRTGINFTREGLREPFEIHPGIVVPPGTYDHAEAVIIGITNQAAPASLEVRLTAGGFFGGSRVALVPSLRARAGSAFNAYVAWERNDVSLPAGRFLTNLVRARVSYSFSPRLYLQALLQYNDSIDNWSTNLRLGWLQTANTGVFLVYNENRDTAARAVRDRSLILKISRQFDLLD